MKKKLMAAVAAGALAVIPASAALADGHEAQVVIVHGVPGFEADIYVNGEIFSDPDEPVLFETVITVDLAPGSYDLAVHAAGADEPTLEETGVEVAGGVSYHVVAGLTAEGEANLFIGANTTDEGEGIQVAHFAAFGNVDITPTDVTGLANVPNGAAGFAATGAGTFEGLGVAAAGADENAINLDPVTVPEGEAVLVFAIGPDVDAELPTLAVTTISVDVDEEPETETEEEAEEDVEKPEAVHSGTGGLLDAGLPVWVAALMVMGALGIAAPAVATSRRRS